MFLVGILPTDYGIICYTMKLTRYLELKCWSSNLLQGCKWMEIYYINHHILISINLLNTYYYVFIQIIFVIQIKSKKHNKMNNKIIFIIKIFFIIQIKSIIKWITQKIKSKIKWIIQKITNKNNNTKKGWHGLLLYYQGPKDPLEVLRSKVTKFIDNY